MLDPHNRRRIEEGMALARAGRYAEAIEVLEKDLLFTMDAAALSYYALSIARVEGDYEQALSLGIMAVRREIHNPDIYLNLGRVCQLGGCLEFAAKAFRKGLEIDPHHGELKRELRGMGLRRRPVVGLPPQGRPAGLAESLGDGAELERRLAFLDDR
ncbi:MAG TPA: hypothetical protein ENJ37_06255 [Deltaproteobacteria bacterium]|nr:hypothetical protein [Deltaproteobacteria bacterium]